jgi:hypothetical protein
MIICQNGITLLNHNPHNSGTYFILIPKSLDSANDFVSPETQKALNDPSQIPEIKQPGINRFDPDNQLLEKTKQMLDDAADFSPN